MHTQTPTHPAGILLKAFVAWYTVEFSRRIVLAGRDSLTVVGRMIPVLFLLRTFVSPWKQIRDTTPRKGFNLEAVLEALTLNLTARTIGMIFRTLALFLGVCAAGAVVLVTVSALIAWAVLPVVLLGFLVIAAIIL